MIRDQYTQALVRDYERDEIARRIARDEFWGKVMLGVALLVTVGVGAFTYAALVTEYIPYAQ